MYPAIYGAKLSSSFGMSLDSGQPGKGAASLHIAALKRYQKAKIPKMGN